MIPDTLIVDLSGEQRIRAVRIHNGTAYAERDGAVVPVATLDGETVEVRPGRRWTVGPWTVSKHGGCSCGGKNRLLKAWTP